MIEFMVLAAPRSGTAWSSVWLTSPYTVCHHDPLWDWYYEEIDGIAVSHHRELCGISCTGLANWPEWVNRHPARKVILHRPREEVAASVRAIGKPPPGSRFWRGLDQVQGLHVPWTDLWEKPQPIWNHLLPGLTFDPVWHAKLKALKIETRPRSFSDVVRIKYEANGIHLIN